MSNDSPQRVLLVGWSGADWDMLHPLVDAGRMPHLERLINQGVAGRISSLQPHVAPLVWNSIATGVRPERHGILSYLRAVDDRLEPCGGWHRRATPFWEICSQAGLTTHMVSWPTYPAEPISGTFVSELFTRCDDGDTANYRSLERAIFSSQEALELDSLRVHPSELDAEDLLPFVPRAGEVDQERDPALAILASRLAETASAHAMATHLLDSKWQVAAVCYDLIDRLGHSFQRFHPPRGQVTSQSYELYKGVMSQAYHFCDLMLGRLLELAGEATTVVLFSDHGFRSGSQRPSVASKGRGDQTWLRGNGVLVIQGPTTYKDRWIWGGSLLDICPTLQALLGLSHAELDGHPLHDAFKTNLASDNARAPHKAQSLCETLTPADEVEIEILGHHLRDEGYLQEAHFTSEDAYVMAQDAYDYNAAQSHLQFGEIEQALELFQACAQRRPEVPRFAMAISNCYLALNQPEQARRWLERASNSELPAWAVAKFRGQLLFSEGNYESALEQFFLSEAGAPRQLGIHVLIGEVYWQLEQLGEAARAYHKELELDEDSFQAHFGLGRIDLSEERLDDALDRFLTAAALREGNPEVHYHLALTLFKLNKLEDALGAIQRALRHHPSLEQGEALKRQIKQSLEESS